jgi:hypothetical protein
MIDIEIPKDINKYEAKLVGPFTARQTGCFAAALGVGIPLFMGMTKSLGAPQDVAIIAMIIVVTPFLLLGWIKPYGMAFEKFIQTAFVSNVLSPKKRKYVTDNNYFTYSEVQAVMRYDVKEREKEMKRKIQTNYDYMC